MPPVRPLLFSLVLACTAAVGAEPKLVGQLTDQVICASDPSQSYALYVPSHYTPRRAWPVIFCFDASARGRMPVERLQAAAEKYGYIVAGSLNSKNGPWPANAAAMQAMVGDVNNRFSLDPHRIYTTGVSGGARVATQVALNGLASGVIACSAGFATPDLVPAKVPFAYFVTAGIEDINFDEVRRLRPLLEKQHVVHRVVIFPGGHEWASAELLTAGVEWLELQAMRAGTRPRDAAFVTAQFELRRNALPAAPAIDRWRALQSLVADFGGLEDLGALADETKALGTSKEIAATLAREESDARLESALIQRLARDAQRGDRHRDAVVREVREVANTAVDSPARQFTRRAALSFCFIARETSRGLLDENQPEKAIVLLKTALLLQPTHSRIAFDLARAHGLAGEQREALVALTQAAANGFSDAKRAESDPAFEGLRRDAKFAAALKSIRENPPEPPRPLRWAP